MSLRRTVSVCGKAIGRLSRLVRDRGQYIFNPTLPMGHKEAENKKKTSRYVRWLQMSKLRFFVLEQGT